MKNFNRITLIVIFVLGIILYWITAYPSITWWDSSEYSTAAACFGLSGAPGSIILTFFGWLLSKLPSEHPAFLFNMFAGVVAALTVILSLISFKKIIGIIDGKVKSEFTLIENISFIITAAIIICSATLWEYATMFTPYILTALFTLLILLSVLKWWVKADEKTSWKNLFLITLLLGIDFSVHRTNTVMMPGIIVMILIRKPKTFINYRSYLAAVGGMILGLSMQLLYIPMSLSDPAFNFGETNNLSSLWDFISMKMYGGGFLTDIFVRKGPLWAYQVPYYLKGFANNFFYSDTHTYVLGYLPALLGLTGIIYLFKTNRKIALALVLFFIISVASAIIYFNLPENYFRTIYRHYLPTFIIFSVFIFCGVFFIVKKLAEIASSKKYVFITAAWLILLAVAITQFAANFKNRDGSKQTFTVDFSKNLLSSIDKNGILFSLGDSDYFPELYLQVAEKHRTDVIVCAKNLLAVDWYVRQYQRHFKDFPYKGDDVDLNKGMYDKWVTQNAAIPLNDQVKKNYNTTIDTVQLSLPALHENNTNYLGDVVIYDIFKTNKFEKPIYFYKGFDEKDAFYTWIKPYLCDVGMLYKLVPDSSMHTDMAAIEKNLDSFTIQGFNDNSIVPDDVSKSMATGYYDMFLSVIANKINKNDMKGAAKYLKKMKDLLPFEIMKPDVGIIKMTKVLEDALKG